MTDKFDALDRAQGNMAGYTASQVAFGWVGVVFEVSIAFGQEQ